MNHYFFTSIKTNFKWFRLTEGLSLASTNRLLYTETTEDFSSIMLPTSKLAGVKEFIPDVKTGEKAL